MSKVDGTHLLVLGAPRSGTTLLSAMLSCHSDIALLNEDTHGASLTLFSKKVKGVKLCVPNQIEYEHNLIMKLEDLFVTIWQTMTNPVYKRLGVRTPIRRGLKSKFSIVEYQDKTEKLIVLGIVRNPYDSIKSIVSRGQQTVRTAEYRWRRVVEVLYQLAMNQQVNTRLVLVDFDKLVKTPSEIMRELLPELGCVYEESVLEGFRHTPQYKGSKKISSSKASAGLDTALTHSLLKNDEVLKEKYVYLISNSI